MRKKERLKREAERMPFADAWRLAHAIHSWREPQGTVIFSLNARGFWEYLDRPGGVKAWRYVPWSPTGLTVQYVGDYLGLSETGMEYLARTAALAARQQRIIPLW